MDIEYKGHDERKQKAREFWLKVLTDYQSGMTPVDIAGRNLNPKTGKKYSREHIYYILRRLRNMTPEDIEQLPEF